jgi:ketosteroid isomerase-like protein
MTTKMGAQKTNENRELLEAGYEAFGLGDLATVQSLFAPDAVWHAQRLGRLSGDHEGWGEIAEFFMESVQLTQGTFRLEVQDILTSDERAAVTVRSRAERDDQRLDSYQVHLYRIEDGKVAEIWQFVDDHIKVGNFWF